MNRSRVKIERVSEQLEEELQLLIGAYFTMEYAIESAALFNPSMAPSILQDAECHGIEDMRLVQFRFDDGEICYFGVYTAYHEALHTLF